MYPIILACLLISTAFAQNEAQLKNNLSIQSSIKAEEAEKVRTGFLGRSFLPSLSLDLGQERFQTGRYPTLNNPYGFLEARFNLFRGGRDKLESGIRDQFAKIGSFNHSLAVREELNKIRKIQWQIIHNMELISLLENEQKENRRISAQAERRARSGVATRSDTLEFDIYASEIKQEIESLEHENKILKIGLLPLLGLESEEGLVFKEKLAHEHDDYLLSRNYSSKTNPSVAKLYAEYESYGLQQESIKRWWTPSLDLYGGYYLYTLRDRDYTAIDARDDSVVGVRLTFEIFDGMRSYNQATSAHYQAESKKLMARHLEKQTNAQFLMHQEDLKHTHEVMHYIEDRIKKSKDYLKVTLNEYDRGVKNSLDALVAMQRYYRYEKQYLEMQKEYQIIKADLLAILGE